MLTRHNIPIVVCHRFKFQKIKTLLRLFSLNKKGAFGMSCRKKNNVKFALRLETKILQNRQT